MPPTAAGIVLISNSPGDISLLVIGAVVSIKRPPGVGKGAVTEVVPRYNVKFTA
jgi:hypothetical protein